MTSQNFSNFHTVSHHGDDRLIPLESRSQPLVSIVTVVRNGETQLEQTICSVMEQTYPHIEYIVVDGNSTDKTIEIIQRYESHITRWISEPDKGIADAWNKGVAMCKGKIIGILNAGDYYAPDCVEKIVRSLNVDSIAVTYGTTILLNEDGTEAGRVAGQFDPRKIGGGLGFYHPGCFFTRTVFDKIGGFSLKYRYAMDCDWLIRCYRNQIPLQKLDNVCYMPIDGISHTQNFAAYGEYLQILVNNGFSKSQVYSYMCFTAMKNLFKTIVLRTV